MDTIGKLSCDFDLNWRNKFRLGIILLAFKGELWKIGRENVSVFAPFYPRDKITQRKMVCMEHLVLTIRR